MKTRVYCAVSCDLFHHGHVRFFEQARAFGDELVVGLMSDQDIAQYKAPPIMSLSERVAVVESCRQVDAVIPNAPPYVSAEWIRKHKIDVVVAGGDYSEETLMSYYRHPREAGILRQVIYTDGISSSEIIQRCVSRGIQRPNTTDGLRRHAQKQDSKNRYSNERTLMSEAIYGRGYQSTGGKELCDRILTKLDVKPDDRVLDLGCGTGGAAIHIANKLGITVVGVDLAEANIEICCDRKRQFPNLSLEYVCHDIEHLPFSESFDWFWCRDSLCYIRDKAQCLRRWKPLLSESRRSVLSDFCRGEGELTREFDDHVYACDYYLSTVQDYKGIIQEAGMA